MALFSTVLTLLSHYGTWVAFLLGACVGSFLNVCIYRIPLGRSVVFPGSHCAACGAPIAPKNNIPIISWFLLKGRASCCQTRVDRRYWMVEFGTACLFAGIWDRYLHTPWVAAAFCLMISGLMVASMIDLDHFIIPDRFTLGGCLVGFVCSALCPALQMQTTAMRGFSWSLAGALFGGFCLLAVGWLGAKVFKKEAMGLGDVKFMAAICSFFGGESVSFVLPVAALFGSVLGLVIIFFSSGSWGTRIPFGPFLALAAVLWIFGGGDLTHAYWNHYLQVVGTVSAPWESNPNPYLLEH